MSERFEILCARWYGAGHRCGYPLETDDEDSGLEKPWARCGRCGRRAKLSGQQWDKLRAADDEWPMTALAPPAIQVLAERLRDGVVDCNNDPVTVEHVIGYCFNDEDSSQLLTWVRDFMRLRHEHYVTARMRAGAPADGLGLYATRDPVSRDVAVALGFTTNPFEPQHGTIVWWLCKLAGWQIGALG